MSGSEEEDVTCLLRCSQPWSSLAWGEKSASSLGAISSSSDIEMGSGKQAHTENVNDAWNKDTKLPASRDVPGHTGVKIHIWALQRPIICFGFKTAGRGRFLKQEL